MVPGFSYGLTPPSGINFPDVPSSAWFHDYIAWVNDSGLITGYEDGTFRPNAPITREELAALLVRARRLDIQHANSSHFADSHLISNWARGYVNTAVSQGWIQGDANGMLRPTHHITRAEAAALFARVLGRGGTSAYNIQGVSSDISIFRDVADPRAWYFYYIIEASHSYWFIMRDDTIIWTSIE